MIERETGDARHEARETSPDIETHQEPEPLPDTPLLALLASVAERVAPERVDRVWIFPPRKVEVGESAVVVVAAFTDLGDDRRRVFAAQYGAPADADTARLTVEERGTAPTDRVERVVEDVLDRLGDDAPAEAPRFVRIEGDLAAWRDMLEDIADRHDAELARRDPRHMKSRRR